MFPRWWPRQLGVPFFIGLVLMLFIGLACIVRPDLFLDEPPATRTPRLPPPEAADDWYQLYFTQPELTASLDAPTRGLPERVAETIDAAEATLDIAMYEFDLKPLAAAIIDAHQRGVRVRLVTETDYLDEAGTHALQAAGIPVVDDRSEDLMHHKFVVVDGAAVWTGSMNFTSSDAYRNNNTVIYLQSEEVAANYTQEFEEMFTEHRFGSASLADTPNPVVTLGDTRLENYFSPDDGVAARLLEVLETAEQSIYFMAFAFTRQDLAQVLLDKAAAGVEVRGVFETRQITAGADQAWRLLTEGGLAGSVRQDGNRYNMHNKVFIIDEAVVVLGSYNFSNNAERRNDENILFIYNPQLAQAMLAEWERIWAEAQ